MKDENQKKYLVFNMTKGKYSVQYGHCPGMAMDIHIAAYGYSEILHVVQMTPNTGVESFDVQPSYKYRSI